MHFDSFFTYLLTEKRCSPHTLSSYKNDLEQFDAYCVREFSTHEPSGIASTLVRSWLAYLMEEGYAASSVHRKLSSINAFFRYLKKMGIVQHNPARGIPKPKKPVRLPVFVDEAAARGLYQITENAVQEGDDEFCALRDQLIVTILYETGIRQAELLNLKDSDLDESIGQIKVLGKRNKMRYVPIGREMTQKLQEYIKMRDEQKFHRTSDHLFVTERGKKISKTFVYLKVKSYLSQVTTIKRKSPHVLRHTFATHMLNNGADLNVIKEILGHSSLAATQVYTHNSIEKLKSIHSRMHPRNN